MEHKERQDLKFKPITEGLGFHPFSDGLPYAPISKPRGQNIGTGATIAGPPRILIRQEIDTVVERDEIKNEVRSDLGFLYLIRRTLAYVVDSLVNSTVCTIAILAVAIQQDIDDKLFYSPLTLGVMGIFILFFNWAIIAAQEIVFNTTIGKRTFGLEIKGSALALLSRSILFNIGALLCGTGILWSLIDREKRCWHDVVMTIQPTNETLEEHAQFES